MKVYALFGKSGTGKSYQAINICRSRGIASIVDDGLFIMGTEIVAGVSAKRQSTMVGAIKTALFKNEEHRAEVAQAIKDANPDSILVIGTSQRMTEMIAEALELPPIDEYIDIEDITTETERKLADFQRNELGKHVIPVPTFRLKKQFSGYFVDPLRMLRNIGRQEKSVVRPTYSYLGDYTISEKVIRDIAAIVCSDMEEVHSVQRTFTQKDTEGIRITLAVNLRYGCKVIDVAKNIQTRFSRAVELMTAFNVESTDVEVRALK